MPLLSPSGNQFSLHKLVAMSTIMSPTHQTHFRSLVQAGGGESRSEVPAHQLYLSHGIQAHLGREYDSLRGIEPTLARAKFEAWLAEVQGEAIALDAEDYKFEQFLETVYYHRGFEAIKEVNGAEKDLTKPLSNYFISSSHNTYLSGNQLMSKSTTDAYKNVLIRGCRCIEIDVHNGEAPDNKSSENLSLISSNPLQSPPNSAEQKHQRHASGSTLSSRAAAALLKADEKYEAAKRKLAEKTGIGRDHATQDERGRKITSSSLEVGDALSRASSVRSTKDGEPLVLHGWTLTAPIGFRAVCKSIREAAFVTSKLPLIVSLEVHADLDQQEIMVDIMKEEWNGLLVDVPHEGCDPEERLPRLEELIGKILIKVKKAVADKQEPSPAGTLAPVPSKTDSDSISGSEDERANAKKKVKICENLSNLGIYTHSEHFVGFEMKSATRPSHIYSIGESQIQDLHETRQQEMFKHNRNFFMRAYPGGFRIDSSNVDPSELWRKGVQMVALNWQNLDEGMMLNEGMFAGEHGWVLKPRGYRNDATEPIEYKSLDLTITVLAGQHIPIPEDQSEKNFHPYVKCELHVEKEQGGSEPLPSEDRKRKTGYQKGDHPDFGEGGCVLQFPTIRKVVEELSFVRFKIEDARYARDDLAAWACIRLDRLQQGYRFVYLLDAKGQATPGLLLLKIEKRVVPCEMGKGEVVEKGNMKVVERLEAKIEARLERLEGKQDVNVVSGVVGRAEVEPEVQAKTEVKPEPNLDATASTILDAKPAKAEPKAEDRADAIPEAVSEGDKTKNLVSGAGPVEPIREALPAAAKVEEEAKSGSKPAVEPPSGCYGDEDEQGGSFARDEIGDTGLSR
ncbi:hypothetical protein LZ554_008951 [Drepanopeziza brunnea f. sp. 'monogermtubi']|nr:hypothetical protein LZ554_008951 [Drepanopeziza brunnea f. sp. 'monogermtubi']